MCKVSCTRANFKLKKTMFNSDVFHTTKVGPDFLSFVLFFCLPFFSFFSIHFSLFAFATIQIYFCKWTDTHQTDPYMRAQFVSMWLSDLTRQQHVCTSQCLMSHWRFCKCAAGCFFPVCSVRFFVINKTNRIRYQQNLHSVHQRHTSISNVLLF